MVNLQNKVQSVYNNTINKNIEEKIESFQEKQNKNIDEERLKKAVNSFTSIFVEKMFKSMRDTVPESKLIDGGYAEDVFTDMLDSEISKLGAGQNNFSNLNKLLFEELNQNR